MPTTIAVTTFNTTVNKIVRLVPKRISVYEGEIGNYEGVFCGKPKVMEEMARTQVQGEPKTKVCQTGHIYSIMKDGII